MLKMMIVKNDVRPSEVAILIIILMIVISISFMIVIIKLPS